MYDMYEIQRCAELSDPHGEKYVTTIDEEETAESLNEGSDTLVNGPFWSLYGHIHAMGAECICDRRSKADCLYQWQQITGCEIPKGIDVEDTNGVFGLPTGREITEVLASTARTVMDYLGFMAATGNRKYPFRPSPEGELKLTSLGKAIKETEDYLNGNHLRRGDAPPAPSAGAVPQDTP